MSEGRLSVRALAQETLRAYGLPQDIAGLPDVQINTRSVLGRVALAGLEVALRTVGRVRRTRSEFLVEIDRGRTRALRRKTKHRVLAWVSRLVGRDLEARSYRLKMPHIDAARDEAARVVLLVHGADASPAVFGDLERHLRMARFRIGTFAYPNDDAIDASGVQLARRLRQWHARNPTATVDIVAHSMGGLVARYMLETPGLDPGNVGKLIMLGTPNQGSQLAVARFLLDLGGYVRRGFTKNALIGMLTDGNGEAGYDMRPGSEFLDELNARKRNPHVRYHMILGTSGPVSVTGFDALRSRAEKLTPRPLRGWLRQTMGSLDEVLATRGDGAVALSRGKLAGVTPVLLPLDHMGLVSQHDFLGRPVAGKVHPAFAQVTAWLGN